MTNDFAVERERLVRDVKRRKEGERGRNKIRRHFYGVSRVVNSDCYVLYSLILQVRNLDAANNFEKSRRNREYVSLSLSPSSDFPLFQIFFSGGDESPFLHILSLPDSADERG